MIPMLGFTDVIMESSFVPGIGFNKYSTQEHRHPGQCVGKCEKTISLPSRGGRRLSLCDIEKSWWKEHRKGSGKRGGRRRHLALKGTEDLTVSPEEESKVKVHLLLTATSRN